MTFLFDTICDDIIEVIVDEKNKIVKKKNKKNHSILLNPVLWDIKMLFYATDWSCIDNMPIDEYYELMYNDMYDENDYPIDVIYEKEYPSFYDKPQIKNKYKSLKIDRGDIELGGVLNPTYKEINIHHIPMDYAFESEQKYYLHEELCEKIKCIN